MQQYDNTPVIVELSQQTKALLSTCEGTDEILVVIRTACLYLLDAHQIDNPLVHNYSEYANPSNAKSIMHLAKSLADAAQ